MTVGKNLAKRLKQARKELGLSQFDFGVLAGIDEATAKSRISHYENGISVPPPQTLQQLAVASSKPIGWFYCADDELELFQKLHALSKSDRKRMIEKIGQLLNAELE